ncbi:N-(5'-phosphoribosyl)anthranilate isomerase [Streptomyces sp. NPDC047315]|uniref:phosphoribosylanthranilate isomerase n=1 Tax=Streptomyces sp. NPDC047315 TaxID=3155142 RepID=UPI00340E0D2F
MLVKICGATSTEDVELLGAAGADLVGLWHGIPGGRADLTVAELSALARAAYGTARLRPVLVTFLQDAETLRAAATSARVRWVQLHGYQPPGMLRALKNAAELTVVKVLHLGADGCVERSLIASYERAGTDVFLLDAVAGDGRIGSTAHRIDRRAVMEVVDRLSRPFLLAGGVSGDSREEYLAVAEHPLFLGIDVDTAARDPGGRLRAGRVTALGRRWRVADDRKGAG